MIDDLKPYPTMKDSGVPWLGEVPEHWEARRLSRRSARSWRFDPTNGEASYSDGDIAAVTPADVSIEGTPDDGRADGSLEQGQIAAPRRCPQLEALIVTSEGTGWQCRDCRNLDLAPTRYASARVH